MDNIRDAIIASAHQGNNKAVSLIAQAKAYQAEAEAHRQAVIDERLENFGELVYETFVGSLLPNGQKPRNDILRLSTRRIESLARKGGAEYDHAVRAVQHCWVQSYDYPFHYRDAVQAICYPPHGYKSWSEYNKKAYAVA